MHGPAKCSHNICCEILYCTICHLTFYGLPFQSNLISRAIVHSTMNSMFANALMLVARERTFSFREKLAYADGLVFPSEENALWCLTACYMSIRHILAKMGLYAVDACECVPRVGMDVTFWNCFRSCDACRMFDAAQPSYRLCLENELVWICFS